MKQDILARRSIAHQGRLAPLNAEPRLGELGFKTVVALFSLASTISVVVAVHLIMKL